MCDCDRPQAFRQHIRKARTAHKCCECGTAIVAGDLYEYTSGIWEKPDSFKTCLPCAEERADIDLYHADDCLPCFGELKGYLREDERQSR
jgi:hypothetical protein